MKSFRHYIIVHIIENRIIHLIPIVLLTGSIFAQNLDTLIYDFTSIGDISSLGDGTFILIGEKRGAAIVSRINGKAEVLWSLTLSDSLFYTIKDYEIHLKENDSTLQIITQKTSCDIVLDDPVTLLTIGFNGEIYEKLTFSIPNSYQKVFLLSGEESQPRCAFISGDSIIIKYKEKELILVNDFPFLKPKLVDFCPSGSLLVQYDLGVSRMIRFQNDEPVYHAGPYITPGATEICCAGNNEIVVTEQNALFVSDSFGNIYNYFYEENAYFFQFKWKPPFIYVNVLSLYSDTIFVHDLSLNLIYKSEIESTGPWYSDLTIFNNKVIRVGNDWDLPYPHGHIESKDFNGVGSKYYDIELIDFTVGKPINTEFERRCNPGNYIYYFPQITLGIKNNGDFPVNELITGYEHWGGHCCKIHTWQKKISNLNLNPGETKFYTLNNFTYPRYQSFQEEMWICLTVSAPDNHADDFVDDNELCNKIEITNILQDEDPFIDIFPNPSNSSIRIFSHVERNFKIHFIDMNGVVVREYEYSDSRIDIDDLQPGMYLIQYVIPDGKIFTEKFVKI